ncbi:helix-turn-helix transcriptional regulator [Embleya hyalina]|uniref:Transcriptional regulator n=1 Tax=Embleya hyalina TaxID=516124 RepID=A0A401YU92_9ACTN|nr:ArsR family transcriptional regulator [Embleya hyalina]GCD98151.1 transcriptional regulator [Embleya hyalina]
MSEQDAFALLPETRREILRRLKGAGELRAEELAEAVGMTASGMRQQLAGLVAEGYVTHRQARLGPGRPKHVYRLTTAGENLFPRRYGDLVGDLLETAQTEEPGFVDRLFDRRRERRLERARTRTTAPDLADRVAAIAAILDEDGYLAAARPLADGGGWLIVEQNCAIFDVAIRCGTACSSELEFLREALPDTEVRRVSHMVAGAPHCAYEIRPRGTRPETGSTEADAGLSGAD